MDETIKNVLSYIPYPLSGGFRGAGVPVDGPPFLDDQWGHVVGTPPLLSRVRTPFLKWLDPPCRFHNTSFKHTKYYDFLTISSGPDKKNTHSVQKEVFQ